MSRTNSFAVNESIVHAKDGSYPYRRGMGMFPSTEWVTHFEDFQGVVASNTIPGWTATIDTGATAVTGGDHGGSIDISSDGVDEGVALYQPASIQLTGKKFFMEVRCKVEDADDNIVVFGLTDLAATTNPEDLYDASTTDMIAFGTITDGDATPVLRTDKDGGGPTDYTGDTNYDLADDTWHVLAIAYNGAATPDSGALRAYVDGQQVASATTASTVPEDVALAPFIAALVEDDATDIITFDYVRWAVQR